MPPPGYLKEVRKICDEHNLPLILDEIQTGMGRTGTMWRCEAEDVVPDVMTFGKAFGGGVMPITGFICRPHMWSQPLIDNPYLLGSTTLAATRCAALPPLPPSATCWPTTSPASAGTRAPS